MLLSCKLTYATLAPLAKPHIHFCVALLAPLSHSKRKCLRGNALGCLNEDLAAGTAVMRIMLTVGPEFVTEAVALIFSRPPREPQGGTPRTPKAPVQTSQPVGEGSQCAPERDVRTLHSI